MIRTLFFTALLFVFTQTVAQSNQEAHTAAEDSIENAKVFSFAEVMPEFPGGDKALQKYLRDNIHYSADEKDKGTQGRVVINFYVDRKGQIREAKVLKGRVDYPEFDKEVLRVVNKMPLWEPGKMNGKAVNVQYNLPVFIELKNEERKK